MQKTFLICALLLQAQYGLAIPGDYPILAGHVALSDSMHDDAGELVLREVEPLVRPRQARGEETLDPTVWTEVDLRDLGSYRDNCCDTITKAVSGVFLGCLALAVAAIGKTS